MIWRHRVHLARAACAFGVLLPTSVAATPGDRTVVGNVRPIHAETRLARGILTVEQHRSGLPRVADAKPTPTQAWELYRWPILAAAGVTALLLMLLVQWRQRMRAQKALARSLDLAQLVTEISATLAAAPAGEMDTAVRDALARVARELGFDTASLVELTDDPRVARVTRSVALSGGQPLSGVLAVDRFPWTLAALRRGDLVQWSTRDGIPSAAQEDRTSFAALGTQGFVALPLTVGQTVVGALSLSKASPIPRWPERPIQELRLLADAFTHVIERRRARTALRESEERLRIMADTAPAHVDITRRRLAETAAGRELGHEHLTRALHVRALGDLTTSMAHEISQPLAAILSNAQAVRSILHRQVGVDADVDGALTDMAHDAKRAAFLIRRLRVLLRDDGAEPRKPVDLNEVTAEVTSVVHTELEPNGIVLQLALDTRLPPVLGDAVQLQQVILNVMTNALEASAEAPDPFRVVSVSTLYTHQGTVEVAIRDRGPGVPDDQRERIFESFVTTKKDRLGMGLSISRSIVEAHGGRIWATPDDDRGLCVHIELPCQEQED